MRNKRVISFKERVEFTAYYAFRLMEHPEEPLDLPKNTIDFFELNLVECHGMAIPQRCFDFFELFFSFYEDNGLNLKNYGSAITQLDDQFKKIPTVNRPKNEIELNNKIKKLAAQFLARSLIEVWKLEEKSLTGDEFKKYLIATSIVFSMLFQEIYNSYYFDVLGGTPSKYSGLRNHSIRLLKTYLCLRCEEVFFSYSNNVKYCPKCANNVKTENQKKRRDKGDRPERCLFCQKILPISQTKPKKYCDNKCRYDARKKKIISPVGSGERASF